MAARGRDGMPQDGHREGEPVGRSARADQWARHVRCGLSVESRGAGRESGDARLFGRSGASARHGAERRPRLSAAAGVTGAALSGAAGISAGHAVRGQSGLSGGHAAAAAIRIIVLPRPTNRPRPIRAPRNIRGRRPMRTRRPSPIRRRRDIPPATGRSRSRRPASSRPIPTARAPTRHRCRAMAHRAPPGARLRAGQALSVARQCRRAALSGRAAQRAFSAALPGKRRDRAAVALARPPDGGARDHRLGDAAARRSPVRSSRRSTAGSPRRCSRRRRNGSASRWSRSSRSRPIRAAA